MTDHTHAPEASSWVPGADTHPDFPVQNLPLGIVTLGTGTPFIGSMLGSTLLSSLDASSLATGLSVSFSLNSVFFKSRSMPSRSSGLLAFTG